MSKESIDVKNIFDIPFFADYANEKFSFKCYDKHDATIMYEFIDNVNFCKITLDFIVDDFDFLFDKEKLVELATYDNIDFFQLTRTYHLTAFECDCYHYRPLVDESQKNYE